MQRLTMALAALFALAIMGGNDARADEPLKVVATTSMIADAARVIGGDDVDVHALMGPGIDPHSYRQTRSDIAAAARADLVLRHGLYLEAQMEASGASIQVGYMPTIKGDPVKLVSLFQNLLSNALKYRSEHRPVITINAERQGNYWLFSVKDNGIGFANEFRDRIFLIFQRLHTQEEYPGTGMGLALCKKIVEQHQGHIYAQSEPGRGATFYFTLPAG